jgi:hypothetical protein
VLLLRLSLLPLLLLPLQPLLLSGLIEGLGRRTDELQVSMEGALRKSEAKSDRDMDSLGTSLFAALRPVVTALQFQQMSQGQVPPQQPAHLQLGYTQPPPPAPKQLQLEYKPESTLAAFQEPAKRVRDERNCFNCGSPDHFKYACPNPAKCRGCGEMGHMIAMCPKKARRTPFTNQAQSSSSSSGFPASGTNTTPLGARQSKGNCRYCEKAGLVNDHSYSRCKLNPYRCATCGLAGHTKCREGQ